MFRVVLAALMRHHTLFVDFERLGEGGQARAR